MTTSKRIPGLPCRLVDRWHAPALSACLGLAALTSCTSFAGLGDTPMAAEGESPTAGAGGGGGSSAAPLPGLGGLAGARGEPAGSPPPVTQTGGTGPVGGQNPDAPFDAGSPAPPGPGEAPVDAVDASVPDDPAPEPPAPEPPACTLGAALALDGATYARVPRLIEDDFTLEAWIRTTETLVGTNGFIGRTVFDSDVIGMGANDDFGATILNDTFAFAVGNPDTTVQGLAAVTTGEWEHVAVTRRASNGQVQIIINGVLDAVGTSSNRNSLSARPDLAFGGFTASRKFIGTMDEIKVWNVVRSVEQIAANLRQPPEALEPGLVGYYSFEDQGLTQTADGSGLGISATLSGNPSYVPSSALCPPRP